MTNYKTTTITNESTNGVFHEVTINLDGTIEAHKIIEGDIVQIYDWSYMSTEEVYKTVEESGHQEYKIHEEERETEKLAQDVSSKEIRKAIEKADKAFFIKGIQFDIEINSENLDVNMTIWDEEDEMVEDVMIATTEDVSDKNESLAKSMKTRLERKFGM